MLDLVPGLVTGLLSGGVIGWVIGHNWASHSKTGAEQPAGFQNLPSAEDEQARIEAVTRKIRSLTLSVAADVSAHQSKVANITTDLEASASESHTDAIVATVAELVAANKLMQERLEQSQQQIREQSKQLQTTQQLANTDALTGLANRRVFDAELLKVQNIAGPQRGTLALIDIDHFKSINDKYGHPTGDQVLSRLAELLDANLGDSCLCSRFGGEEFAIFHASADWEKVAQRLEKTRLQLSSLRLIPEDPSRQITYSCGVAAHFKDESNEAWLARVDAALYAAKHDNRDNVRVDEGTGSRRYSPVPESEKAISTIADTAKSEPREKAPLFADNTPATSASPGSEAENRRCLISQLRTMANNIDPDRVSLAAVAIRLPESQYQPEQHEELIAQTRSLLRSVDRIGFDDQRTMLALMVTSDMRKTEEKASQLLDAVNNALANILHSDASGSCAASLGISMLDDDSPAEGVIATAIQRASRLTTVE